MAEILEVGHSPDPDDAFMFYALTAGKLKTGDLEFRHVLQDIETLNRWAMEGRLPVTALSLHAYAYVADTYALLPHGASMGRQYGPIVVSRRPLGLDDLRRETIAVPGRLTTAFLTLRLCLGDFSYVVLPFDQILMAVARGEVGAGVIIHEGQLTYKSFRLVKALDLGVWWHRETGLPLPLGVNAVRKDLGEGKIRQVSRLLRESIRYALEHRDEALTYAMAFARGMDRAQADTFVGMYVNDLTLSCGPEGREAVERMLQWAYEKGIVPHRVRVQFVE